MQKSKATVYRWCRWDSYFRSTNQTRLCSSLGWYGEAYVI